ncbi:MAG: Aspartyl/glutamyl-tRNA(Asn/Gln) amidotransferase subunit B [Candidatus Woesebacteria bacterium GW2011_GWB1_38_5b]|uniref:Aspartyl/glutamyl-tRNA(Asn/Gln) amidotransferase subunit B n=3 Tax=Microgenomates group TaxID=1794810 RepID=A0A1F5G7Z9_9BACT|nr:MAG: Aspartyl/glutamyl-tRNA(Asn/Gln) amidotransferase subunit B [Candidatus Woesebacteria bacterium GW2011_GWB1_38_5b]OGD83318.1 MAG: glutaminyl-tRNA synthase (glutamine-hydrolyzing) subunit B [Candidatus Curtissbacteria bacterium RIFCSPHIGHO2_01_FULL_39_57]OGD88013.1 MAG: glutaminyl-tRNA synthase (glutamine-hydrolyzing) subunit B [Candidatus Curtissbacteria bacterium RIFCSPHIGHO2_02_FULL_40_16b]OGD90831.1 MAG: glutaminyl-tRNA synthase (glutamine-hydrolyzing) subunit B [Candidatus Curtissbact
MNYEAVIGLEVHIELETDSKMFCRCSTDYFTAKPNTHTCPVCLGLPGALPVANQKAIEYAQRFGLALGCDLFTKSKFDRKNYFYPDLAKGFQISQYELPFSQKGSIEIRIDDKAKKINITRAHLEEDTGKLTHAKVKGKNVTLIDFNRSGVPLLEIVSDPDITSALEAKSYAQKLQQLARYLEVSSADMEKGSMRIEPNVSLRKSGEKALPDYKVELKNINSFKFAEGAINYELERQTKALEKGERLIQETRGWNEKENKTVSQRFKEEAHDYRYFPEPDLPPLSFNTRHLSNIKRNIPEMPDVKLERFKKQYNFASYDAQILTSDKIIADFFEETLKAYKKDDPKRVANWIIGELLRRLRENGKSLKYIDLLPANLAELLYLADTAEITQNIAKEVFAKMLETGKTAQSIIKSMGLTKMSVEDLEVLINKILKENKKAVNDFRKGKEASIGFLIGQVQKEAKGQADANLTRRLLLEKLK